MEGIFKKKKKAEHLPVFNHDLNSIDEAIGVENIQEKSKESLRNFMKKVESLNINKHSQLVELVYNGMTKLELAVVFSKLISSPKNTESTETQDEE